MTTKRILSKPAEGEDPEKLYYEQEDEELPKKLLSVDLEDTIIEPILPDEIFVFSPDPEAEELEIYVEEIKDEFGEVIGKEVLYIDEDANLPQPEPE